MSKSIFSISNQRAQTLQIVTVAAASAASSASSAGHPGGPSSCRLSRQSQLTPKGRKNCNYCRLFSWPTGQHLRWQPGLRPVGPAASEGPHCSCQKRKGIGHRRASKSKNSEGHRRASESEDSDGHRRASESEDSDGHSESKDWDGHPSQSSRADRAVRAASERLHTQALATRTTDSDGCSRPRSGWDDGSCGGPGATRTAVHTSRERLGRPLVSRPAP